VINAWFYAWIDYSRRVPITIDICMSQNEKWPSEDPEEDDDANVRLKSKLCFMIADSNFCCELLIGACLVFLSSHLLLKYLVLTLRESIDWYNTNLIYQHQYPRYFSNQQLSIMQRVHFIPNRSLWPWIVKNGCFLEESF
jgi:hypothetical protein